MKASLPIQLWTIEIITVRGRNWLMYHTVRRTRKEAIEAYLADHLPEYVAAAIMERGKRWRPVKVTVSVEEGATL